MEYMFAIVIMVVEIGLVAIYIKKVKLFDSIEKQEESNEDNTYTNKMYTLFWSSNIGFYVFLGVMIICMMVSTLMIIPNISNLVNYTKLILLLGLVATAAIIDLKKKIIPNELILVGIVIRVLLYIVEYFVFNDVFFAQLKSDVFGFIIGVGVFLISAIVSKGAVGFGDVKLFGVIGIFSGALCTYSTMMCCLVASAIVSIFLLIVKKKNRKDTIPFGPCIFIGYLISILLSNY